MARGGKSSIDHPPGAGSHDDVANSVAGVWWLLRVEQKPMTFAAPIIISRLREDGISPSYFDNSIGSSGGYTF